MPPSSSRARSSTPNRDRYLRRLAEEGARAAQQPAADDTGSRDSAAAGRRPAARQFAGTAADPFAAEPLPAEPFGGPGTYAEPAAPSYPAQPPGQHVFTETQQTGYGTRLKNAAAGLVIGTLLFFGSFVLLFWNEQRLLTAEVALDEAIRTVATISPFVLDPAREGQLVYFAGRTSTSAGLADPAFGVLATDALRLRRKVEMYQWTEQTDSTTTNEWGGGQTTTKRTEYRLQWSEQPVNSGNFRHFQGHENPPMPFDSRVFDAADARLGEVRLDDLVLQRMTRFEPLSAGTVELTKPNGFRRLGDSFYRGRDPANPQLGDVRLQFEVVRNGNYSVLGRQSGSGVAEAELANGYTLLLVEPGQRSARAMIEQQRGEEQFLSWLLRAAGLLVMTVGVVMFLSPLEALLAVVPLLADVMAASLLLVALIITVPLTLTTIAVSWLFLRPLWAIGLMVVGLGVGFVLYRVAAR